MPPRLVPPREAETQWPFVESAATRIRVLRGHSGALHHSPLAQHTDLRGQADRQLREQALEVVHTRDRLAAATGLALSELSMGMTDDFEVAIEEGATIVRVGRAVFGERPR